MPKPHGITVTLYQQTETGVDEFNHPSYAESAVQIEDVLVAPVGHAQTEITDTVDLYGKRAEYILGIPKGDTHVWENCRVSFFGEDWRVIGKPTEGIEDLIPLRWNKKVVVESYVAESSSGA